MKVSAIKIGKQYVFGRGWVKQVDDIKDGQVYWTGDKGRHGSCKLETFANMALSETVRG